MWRVARPLRFTAVVVESSSIGVSACRCGGRGKARRGKRIAGNRVGTEGIARRDRFDVAQ
eukprot:4303328-Pyramimonas_sp.AAC.1